MGSAVYATWRRSRSASSWMKGVAHGGRVESGRAEAVQVDVPFLHRQQLALPRFGNGALLGHQRAGAELEDDGADLGIVEPVLPVAQVPDPARHHDGHVVEAVLVHLLAQGDDSRIGGLGLFGILAVGKPVVAAGAPGVLVDDAAHPLGEAMVGALPERAERACRRDDRVVVDFVLRGHLGEPVGHPGAAGHAVNEAARGFEDAVQDALGGGHLPQHVHVEPTLAAGDVVGDPGLRDAAPDRVVDELLVTLLSRAPAIDLRHGTALLVVGIGVDAGEGADAAGGGPGAGTQAVGHADALAPFDQGQDLATRQPDCVQRLHSRSVHRCAWLDPRAVARQGGGPAPPLRRDVGSGGADCKMSLLSAAFPTRPARFPRPRSGPLRSPDSRLSCSA